MFYFMNREQLLFLAPYAISMVVLAGIFLYALRERYLRGARPFAWIVGGQLLTTLAFLLELISPESEAKMLWDTVQWLTTGFLIVLPLLVFAVQFSEYGRRSAALTWGLVLIVLAVFMALLLTNRTQHLFYSNPRLSAGQSFPELQYDLTMMAYLYILLYLYGASVYAISLLIWRAYQPQNLFRHQYWIIAAGFLFPVIFSLFPWINLQFGEYRDLTPVAFAAGSLVAAWGLFRYGLFDITPAARQQFIENLSDPVIVLDRRNRIVDVNKAGLVLIEKQSGDVVGRTPEAALGRLPFLADLINEPYEQSKEVTHSSQSGTGFLQASISDILGRRREQIGRIIVIRDLTRLKTLEENYRSLSEAREQLAEQRTEELHRAAERCRSLLEHIPDFIIRWKPDGTRTFVNEAYYHYWGITPEQALARNFLFHTAEEDRPDIEKKIVRLNAGAAEIETGVYRATKLDGTLAWHEWKDQAVRDEWGKLIEIQSVGRDITSRQQTEENLNS
jgi:PAS domain S-box-containing protein